MDVTLGNSSVLEPEWAQMDFDIVGSSTLSWSELGVPQAELICHNDAPAWTWCESASRCIDLATILVLGWTAERYLRLSKRPKACMQAISNRSLHRSYSLLKAIANIIASCARPLFFVFLCSLPSGCNAVTCVTCFDGIPGCAGGAACPFLVQTAANLAALTVAGGAAISVAR